MKLNLTRAGIIAAEIVFFIISIFLLFWTHDDQTILWKDIVDGGERDYGGMCWQHQGLTAIFWFFMIYMFALLVWEIVAKTDDDQKAPFQKLLERFGIDTSHHDTGKAAYDNHSRFQSPRNYSRDDDEDNEDETKNKIDMKFNWRKIIGWAIAIVLVVLLFKLGKSVYQGSVFVYNQSKNYHNVYQQRVEEKQGYYDKLWKTFYEKKRIANLNKDVFRDITIIIMENRSDGENVTWKWLQENQHIPYEEYTKFYTDLTNFIHSQREGYYAIEKACQQIARQHNTLVDTFPNNIYNNWFLKQERIIFEYGMLSDSTLTVFETGVENIPLSEELVIEKYEKPVSEKKEAVKKPVSGEKEAALLKLLQEQK